MSDKIITLGDLKIGESGYVKTVDADNARRRRIVDMGITPGTHIHIVKAAPMGDPLEVSLRGYTLSLRREDARSIQLLSDEEAKVMRAEMVTAQRQLELEANRTLSHAPDEDSEHHKRAAMLTEFILQKQSCPADCSECKAGCGLCGEEDELSGTVRIALVGNPNSGKTTLFNAMTGSREYVGNWPGVTVEKKEGRIKNSPLYP